MIRSLYAVARLILEAGAARRDIRIRFLKAQVDIPRRKLGGNRVIVSPDDRRRLLAIGAELKHNVSDVIGIVTPQTYARWHQQHHGGTPARPGARAAAGARERGLGLRPHRGRRRKLRVLVSRGSVRRVLRESGVPPTDHRKKPNETL